MLSSVRIMASRASLLEGRLMKDSLVLLVGLIHVTIQANVDPIRLWKRARLAGVRVMTVGAIALRSGMLELGLLDLVRLIGMAANAKVFHFRLRQHDFSVLGCFVTDFAELFAKRRMCESLHQLGLRRLVRIVTGDAIGFRERLPLVRFDQRLVARIVTVEAKRRRRLGEMKCEFGIRFVARLVGNVTGVASEIESVMPTPALGRIQTGLVAVETEVFGGRSARSRLQ